MAVIRVAAVLCVLLVCVTAGVLKTKPTILRFPRSIDLSAAHSLINEPKLDNEITPLAYELEFEPDINNGIFKGKVTIKITWLKDTDEIALHAHQSLNIGEVIVKAALNDSSVPVSEMTSLTISRTSRNPKRPILTFKLSKEIPKNTVGEITITYDCKLHSDTSEGVFRALYQTKENPANYIVGTHLRPNNARRVFPCFDEPSYKTTFDISIKRPKTMTALSNTRKKLTEEVPETDLVRDVFETTPPMSTFAVGFVVTDLKQVNSAQITTFGNNKIDITIHGREEFKPALEHVLEKVIKTYMEIVQYWKLSLPLKKLDIVAFPNYLGVKPADNWGLIVFKESELAADGYLQLAQELTYQWMGNLVTPSWWSEAHLNKALVGYIAADTAIKIDNGSEMDGKWPMTILYSLYYEFSKRYPHSRITGMKQETTCSKIELLFRMLNYTLGEHAFKKGLQKFMADRRYLTFNGDDIWSALNNIALEEGTISKDINVSEIASSWITKDRIPVVNVDRNYKTKTATVRQRVYLRERPHDVPGQDKLIWWIPLVIVKENNLNFSNTVPKIWMNKVKEMEIKDLPDSDMFIIVNPEEIGPFPVNYDTENWNMLAKYLTTDSRTNIPVFTRAKLLHDAWNLAYAGDLSFATALNMTLFLSQEREHLVWDPVFTMIDHIGRHIDSSEVHKKFETYVRLLLTPLYEELSANVTENDENSKVNLRGLSKTFLCRAGYRPCIEEAQAAFKKWMDADDPDEGNPVPNQYICPVFKWGTKAEWEFGLERIINFPPSRKASERTYLLKTLAGCPITSWKIERLLNITILEENGNFTENDIYLIFSMLTGGSRGYTTLFDFLQNNWDTIKIRFADKTNLWDNLISSATSVFTTQEGLDMVTKLYVSKQGEFGSAEHIIEKSLKNIREETKWSDENLPVVEKWLDNHLRDIKIEDKKFIGYD